MRSSVNDHRGTYSDSMKAPGTLAIVGFALLLVQSVFGGALNRATHDSPYAAVPLALGLILLWISFWRGLAKGPLALQSAMLLGLGSLATFGYAILTIGASSTSRSVSLALSAALFILAITFGLRAYMDEVANRNPPNERGVSPDG